MSELQDKSVDIKQDSERITFSPDKFNQDSRTGRHGVLIRNLNRELPGASGRIFGEFQAGPSFIGFVYERLKTNKEDTDYSTILLTANLLVDNKSYPNFSTHPEYKGRIRNYLEALQRHIKDNPEQYTEEFMTKQWTDEELGKL